MEEHLKTREHLQKMLKTHVKVGKIERSQIAVRAFLTFLIGSAAIGFVATSVDSIPEWIASNVEFWQSDIVPVVATKVWTICIDGVANACEWVTG